VAQEERKHTSRFVIDLGHGQPAHSVVRNRDCVENRSAQVRVALRSREWRAAGWTFEAVRCSRLRNLWLPTLHFSGDVFKSGEFRLHRATRLFLSSTSASASHDF
jgi:hypothetical protein